MEILLDLPVYTLADRSPKDLTNGQIVQYLSLDDGTRPVMGCYIWGAHTDLEVSDKWNL